MQTASTSSSSSWARTAQPGGERRKARYGKGRDSSTVTKENIKKAVSGNWSADKPQILLREFPRSAELLQEYLQHSRGQHEQQGHHCSGPPRGSSSCGSIIISINNNNNKKSKNNRKDIHYLERFPLYSARNAENTESRTLSCRGHFPNATILVTCKLLKGSSNPTQRYLKSRNQTAQERPWKMHSE